MHSVHAELLILGSGPAGYSAAVHAARANLRPMLISGTSEESRSGTDPWPADVDMVQGTELKQRLRDHAERPSTRVIIDRIKAVNLARRPFKLKGEFGSYTCNALIVAVDTSVDTKMFNGQLNMRNGQIVALTGLSGTATTTSRSGVFVAGDLQEPHLDQLITRTGTGCMAALDAQRFLGL